MPTWTAQEQWKVPSFFLDARREGPRTAFELISAVFGKASLLQLFLMLSEIVGNLEVLEARGKVTHDPAEAVYRYRRV